MLILLGNLFLFIDVAYKDVTLSKEKTKEIKWLS